jgi:hypothetical protein
MPRAARQRFGASGICAVARERRCLSCARQESYGLIEAIKTAVDDYAEREMGNGDTSGNKPHGIGDTQCRV